jgi:hypothetical protein
MTERAIVVCRRGADPWAGRALAAVLALDAGALAAADIEVHFDSLGSEDERDRGFFLKVTYLWSHREGSP